MAATCEISNVFSNYFNAMYSSEDPTLAPAPPTTFGTEDLVLTLNNQQMSLGGPGEGCAKSSWTGHRPERILDNGPGRKISEGGPRPRGWREFIHSYI